MAIKSIFDFHQFSWLNWKSKLNTAIVISVVILATGLRLYNIDWLSFNNDEVFSIWLSRQDIPHIIEYTTFGGKDVQTPPLHYLLLHTIVRSKELPITVRLPSVISGVMMVCLTICLAFELFGARIGLLSGFLIAIAPFHIAISRTGRAHALASLMILASVYFFMHIYFKKPRLIDWVGLVLSSTLAVWTFYTTLFALVFENLFVGLLLVKRRISTETLIKWEASQVLTGLFILFPLISALKGSSISEISWLNPPGIQELVKTVIFFSTGDPSSGPSALTWARALSLGTIAGICLLGIDIFYQQVFFRRLDDQGKAVIFILGATLLPWMLIFGVSQIKPIYQLRYILYIMPFLSILFAWILTQNRLPRLSVVLLVLLIGLNISAARIYFYEPGGEQWREAVSYLRSNFNKEDIVVISPGHYVRPFSYYFQNQDFPPHLEELAYVPILAIKNGALDELDPKLFLSGAIVQEPLLRDAERIWLVSGYSPVDSNLLSWIKQNYIPVQQAEFEGAKVYLYQHNPRQGSLLLEK